MILPKWTIWRFIGSFARLSKRLYMKPVKNVCIISPHVKPLPFPCGVAGYVDKLSLKLAEQGLKVTLLTSNSEAALSSNQKQHSMELKIVVGSWGINHVWKMARAAAEGSPEGSFDVIDVQYEAAMFRYTWPSILLPLFIKILSKSHVVLTLHSQTLPRVGGRLWRPLQILLYDKVIFYSKPLYERMSKRFSSRKESFFLQGFPSNITRYHDPDIRLLISKTIQSVGMHPFLMIYFGFITSKRSIEDILSALQILKSKINKVSDVVEKPHLLLIGKMNPDEDLYHRQLLEDIQQRGLSGYVSFSGELTDHEVSRAFQAADLCILPFPEGASFKNGSLAAAIEHEIPIITTKTELTEEELLQNDCLKTYKPGDVSVLSSIMYDLLFFPAKRKSLREKMVSLKDHFSWIKYIETRMQIYGKS